MDNKKVVRQMGLVSVADGATGRVEGWTAYVEIGQLQVPCAPIRQAANDLFEYAMEAQADNLYLVALSHGLLDMQKTLLRK